MLDQSRNALVTIAGTGELGFQGDGGPARLAQLRKPEGLALKPGLSVGPDNVGRELYFADFVNQRIRKLVRTSNDWVIYTVAGNGGMADDPLCDGGCPALETSLWNPPLSGLCIKPGFVLRGLRQPQDSQTDNKLGRSAQ